MQRRLGVPLSTSPARIDDIGRAYEHADDSARDRAVSAAVAGVRAGIGEALPDEVIAGELAEDLAEVILRAVWPLAGDGERLRERSRQVAATVLERFEVRPRTQAVTRA